MNKRTLRIGSRDSVLAVNQTKIIISAIARSYPETDIELVTMKTAGDLNQRPFGEIAQNKNSYGAKGLFVNELEHALTEGRIDLAVHSLKDMPAKSLQPDYPLPILAFFKRGDPRDALVLPQRHDGGHDTETGKNIGCSSERRRVQLEKIIPGCPVRPIRGNVLTRLKKLDEGQEYSSLVLAAAGLRRLGLESRINRTFEPDEIIPAAGQGILACQGRARDKGNLSRFIDVLNDADSEYCAGCEMAFIERLGGGCTLPMAAYAEAHGTELRLTGLYVDEPAGIYRKSAVTGDRKNAVKLGETLAELLMRGGGDFGL